MNYNFVSLHPRPIGHFTVSPPMYSTGPLQLLMRPALLPRPFLSTLSPHSILLNPISKLRFLHSSRLLAGAVVAMAGVYSSVGASSPEHFAGAWYSVPDLRLRDHYFTVPLDYSLDRSSCPKITIFAREVVSGTEIDSLIMFNSLSSWFIVFDLIQSAA